MGLDTSHNAWHGAYGSFARWRNAVASAAGYEIALVEIAPGVKRDGYVLDWDSYEPENFRGEWRSTPDDPLIVLLAHSDCDGVIHPEQAGPLADRLAELLPEIAYEIRFSHYGNTERFIAGLRAAVAANEDLDFH